MQRKAWFAVGLLLATTGGLAVGATCEVGAVPPVEDVAAAFEGTPYTLVRDLAVHPFDEGAAEGETLEHACLGKIRPGAPVIFNNSYLCSLNFIFRDAQGALYVGTAGHCVPSSLPAMNIRVSGLSGDIGDPAFSTGNGGVGHDFALIRIDPAFYGSVETSLCRWGGPVGLATTSPGNDGVLHYGFGTFWGEGPETRGRATVLRAQGFGSQSVSMTAAAGPGDSGSAMILDGGQALGVLTHGSAGGTPWIGTIWASRVDTHVAKANAAQPTKGYALVDGSVPVDLTGFAVPG